MNRKRVIIIGAGAAGLTASVFAAEAGALVTLLEHNEKPGKKICATGNGKCNFTNERMSGDVFRGTHPEFAENILRQFPPEAVIAFFEKLGIFPVKKNGYYYPRSGQASSIAELLVREARYRGVKIKTNAHADAVFCEKGIWKVVSGGWTYEGDAVILANGSSASSIAGADGSGYDLARALGHHLIPPMAALCPLKCSRPKGRKSFAGWAGVRIEGTVILKIKGDQDRSQSGELQLTEYGISGIPVFQLSRYAVRAIADGKEVSARLNFLPEISKEELPAFLEKRRSHCHEKSDQELLKGLFPDKLIKVLCQEPELASAIHSYPLIVKGGSSIQQAQVCSGGVDTEELDPETLESRLHPGLYMAGELIDIDGTCGGYNLQWAWSSGAAAGLHAAKEQL